MMAAATTTLSSVAAARKAPAARSDASDAQDNGDSFGSLLGAAPAESSSSPPATGTSARLATKDGSATSAKKEDTDTETDHGTSAEVAAMIAALLAASSATPAASAAATSASTSTQGAIEAGAAGTAGNAASTGNAAMLAAQLQDSADTASDPATTTTAPSAADTDATADKLAGMAGFQQLLQSRTSSPTASAGASTSSPTGADIKLDAAPLNAMLSQLAGDSTAPARDVAAVVAAAGSQLDADAPQSQGQPSTQAQGATLAPTPLPQPTSTASTQTIQAPVGTPRWADELGSRMVMMNLRGQHEGSLNLTPDHLGPLEVRVSVNQGTANVWFGSQHADTRAALTEALPRLREMFADAGLTLGHAGVSQEAPRQNNHDNAGARSGSSGLGIGIDTADLTQPTTRVALGLVDTYA